MVSAGVAIGRPQVRPRQEAGEALLFPRVNFVDTFRYPFLSQTHFLHHLPYCLLFTRTHSFWAISKASCCCSKRPLHGVRPHRLCLWECGRDLSHRQPHGSGRSVKPVTCSRFEALPHSERRFPAPSSKEEGCRKPVLGVWGTACSFRLAALSTSVVISGYLSLKGELRKLSS